LNYSTNKIIILLCYLLLSCSACGSQTSDTVAGLENESYSDSVDTACSYSYFLWGLTAENDNNYGAARESFEKAMVCDPAADDVAVKLAMLLMNIGKNEQAVAELEKIIARNPDNITYRSLLAGLYGAMDNYPEAIKTYLQILKTEPDDPHTMLMLGSLYARQRKYSQAITVLEKLVKLQPDSFMAYTYLAKLYHELRFFDKSFSAYEKALELRWSDQLAFELARFYTSRERIDDAEDVYLRILENEPGNEMAMEQLARLYLRQKKVDKSLAQLQALRDVRVDHQVLDLTIGRILLDQGKKEEAINHFKRMLKEDDCPEDAYTLLALTYYETGRKEEALKVLQRFPPDSAIFTESVVLRVKMLQEDAPDRAKKLLLEMISNNKTRQPEFYFILAAMYRQDKQFDKAEEVFDQACQIFPDNSRVLFEYGLYLDRIGATDKALTRMERVIELSPDDPSALNYVGYTWADQGIKLDKALEYVTKAVELKPDDGYIRDSLGWVYYKMKKYDKAVKELQKALSLQDNDPTINEHLGDAYVRQGDRQKALQVYTQAIILSRDEDQKKKVKKKIAEIVNREKD
jgi:tetratricopeptide (TPR) repeat protein